MTDQQKIDDSAKVPEDRTLKVPSRGFCRNPECRTVSNEEFTFEIKHDNFCCPKCKADRQPMIGVLTLTHLMLPAKDGPIIGAGGLRYRLACDKDRAYLATVTNNEAASPIPAVTNCPECVKSIEKLSVKKTEPTGGSAMILEK
jgi:hypothetical protein